MLNCLFIYFSFLKMMLQEKKLLRISHLHLSIVNIHRCMLATQVFVQFSGGPKATNTSSALFALYRPLDIDYGIVEYDIP